MTATSSTSPRAATTLPLCIIVNSRERERKREKERERGKETERACGGQRGGVTHLVHTNTTHQNIQPENSRAVYISLGNHLKKKLACMCVFTRDCVCFAHLERETARLYDFDR